MSPRILILSASIGSGHMRAAQALASAIRQLCPDAVTRQVDILDLVNRPFRKLYSDGYLGLLSAAPHLIGYLYDRFDRPLTSLERAADRAWAAVQRLNVRALEDLLTYESWDLAINTHFLPAEVVALLRKTGRIRFPHLTVTTDFDVHRMWVNEPCDHYFTATDEGRINLMQWGVPPQRVTASGIPIDPAFARELDSWECKVRLDLVDDRPTVLQLSSGAGCGAIERVHRRLLDVTMPLQIVTVTGRDVATRQALEAMTAPNRHRRVVLGYTRQMDELMTAADVIVSKPGGLTTSEALCRGAAMLIVDPIPGQEARNSDYLLEGGAAVKVNNLASLPYKLTSLLTDPLRLQSLRASARALARPRAAFAVAEHALRMLGSLPSYDRLSKSIAASASFSPEPWAQRELTTS